MRQFDGRNDRLNWLGFLCPRCRGRFLCPRCRAGSCDSLSIGQRFSAGVSMLSVSGGVLRRMPIFGASELAVYGQLRRPRRFGCPFGSRPIARAADLGIWLRQLCRNQAIGRMAVPGCGLGRGGPDASRNEHSGCCLNGPAAPRRVGPPGLHARRECGGRGGAQRRRLDQIRLNSAAGALGV